MPHYKNKPCITSSRPTLTNQVPTLQSVHQSITTQTTTNYHPRWQNVSKIPNCYNSRKLSILLCRTVNPEVYAQPERHSLIGMPHAQMMISGGRFREIYYWDSYWIMKGLLVCDMHQSARQTLENIMWLSTLYGHTMNGNRIYYQNRSQPPLLASMMNLIYEYEGNNDSFIVHNKEFLHILKQDYLWWMDQQSLTIKRNNREYTVNRYYVDSDEPRPEGYVEDTALVSLLKNESLAAKKKAYSAVKAGAEAGWDFSSRWCLHQFCDKDMVNIDTLNVIPVELNAFFYRIEYLLYKFFKLVGEQQEARYFKQAMLNRSRVFAEFLWDNDSEIWRDWNVKEHKLVNQTTISNYLPLWVLPYNATLANMTLNHLNTSGLIRWGGVATTLTNDTQQWDLPDSWPPLQYLVAEMCQRYREELVIARQIEQNVTQTFVSAAFIGWYESGYMHEKYNVLELGASGVYGEYTPQTGFGWTNGVAFSFLHDYGNVLTAPQQSEDEPVDD